MTKKSKLTSLFLLLAFPSFAFGAPLEASDFKTLLGYMSTAAEGDTIQITANITGGTQTLTPINPNITIDGTQYSIDGSDIPAGAGPIFLINTSGCTIQNLTIQGGVGGNGTSSNTAGTVGGVEIAADGCTLSSVTISGCDANGYYTSDSSTVGAGGVGGLSVSNFTNFTLDSCTIESCEANGENSYTSGIGVGGCYFSGSGVSTSTVNFTGTTSITANIASAINNDFAAIDGGVGGMYATNCTLSFGNSTLIVDGENTASGSNAGGGLDLAGGNGGVGGISLETVVVTADGATFQINSNVANGGSGLSGNGGVGGIGGLYISGASSVSGTVSSLEINSNVAAGGGSTSATGGAGGTGALYIGAETSLTFQADITISDNSANGGDSTSATGGAGGNILYIAGPGNSLEGFNINLSDSTGGSGSTNGDGGSVIYVANSNNEIYRFSITDSNVSPGSNTSGAAGADGYIIYLEANNSNTILGNTISGSTGATLPTNVIYLYDDANYNQPTFTEDFPTCTLCLSDTPTTYKLMISGGIAPTQADGTGQMLLQAFLNSSADPECNYYVGSALITAGEALPPITFDNIDDTTINNNNLLYVSFTVTNSSYTNTYTDPLTGTGYSNLGGTSGLSEGVLYLVS